MTTEIDLLWLDDRQTLTLPELARACGLAEEELHELVEYGALAPVEPRHAQPVFSAASVPGMRAAGRLRRDLELDLFAVALLLESLDRIESLERRVAALEAQRPRALGGNS